uniref:Transcriptional repressor rco-1 n=1 Tax=Ganoderma boninense TaxID=34458 RepID=A0A5K1JYE2_9APHY|nr:Transcriptional repressor rco-1 [Ganoderma boninense]
MKSDSRLVDPTADAGELNAGEQDLPSGDSETSNFDPVGVLMDYMLATTQAEYAVAEFKDILAIFGTTGIPDDIMAGLEAIRPPIEVDEDGVATVIVDTTTRFEEQTAAQSTEIGRTQAAQEAAVRGDLASSGLEQA